MAMRPLIWPQAGSGLGSRVSRVVDIGVGELKRVIDFVLYDTGRIIIGTTTTPTNTFTFFQNPVGSSQQALNTTTTFRKTYTDTNLWGQGGQLPNGNYMEIRSIQFTVNLANALDTTPLGTAATINGTRSTDASAENQLLAYMQTGYWEFRMDNTPYERGLIEQAPSSFFQNGNGYSGATTVAGGTVANGMQGRELNQYHYLNEMQPFEVAFFPQATITNVQQVLLRCCLVGRLFSPIT